MVGVGLEAVQQREKEEVTYLLIKVVRLCMPWPVPASSEDMF